MSKHGIDPEIAGLVGPNIAYKWHEKKVNFVEKRLREKLWGDKLLFDYMAVVSRYSEETIYDSIIDATKQILSSPELGLAQDYEFEATRDESSSNDKKVLVEFFQNEKRTFLVEASNPILLGGNANFVSLSVYGNRSTKADWIRIIASYMLLLNDDTAAPMIK